MEMFDRDNYCLLEKAELEQFFGQWDLLVSSRESFPAPQHTLKTFATLIARKPPSPR